MVDARLSRLLGNVVQKLRYRKRRNVTLEKNLITYYFDEEQTIFAEYLVTDYYTKGDILFIKIKHDSAETDDYYSKRVVYAVTARPATVRGLLESQLYEILVEIIGKDADRLIPPVVKPSRKSVEEQQRELKNKQLDDMKMEELRIKQLMEDKANKQEVIDKYLFDLEEVLESDYQIINPTILLLDNGNYVIQFNESCPYLIVEFSLTVDVYLDNVMKFLNRQKILVAM